VQPFLDWKHKGVIVLCRTSNPGARDFQDLEIGGGRRLYHAVAERVHAVDSSERMVRLAREKVRRASLANVTVKRAEAERLPFEDASLDAVFAFHLLRHLVKPSEALAEFGRVVKPGGRVVLVELEPHGHRALREATGSTHLGLPRETVRAGLRRAGFADARFSALAAYRVPSEAGETLLPTYLVDAVRAARGEKEPS